MDNQLQEAEEKNSIQQEYDEIFKEILANPQKAAGVISRILELDYEINKNEIEKYDNSFITDRTENKEVDIIYRLKGKDIFFLIEHQFEIDDGIPLRILQYEYVIIKDAIDSSRKKQEKYKLPRVIPIIIYIGNDKKGAKERIKEVQEEVGKRLGVEFTEYKIVNIDELKKQ